MYLENFMFWVRVPGALYTGVILSKTGAVYYSLLLYFQGLCSIPFSIAADI